MLKYLLVIISFLVVPTLSFAKNLAAYEHSTPTIAPPLNFTDGDGNTHTLNDFRGKVVLLNFWATWCKPCVLEMPALSHLQDRLKDAPIEVVAVSLDTNGHQKVKDFYVEQQISNLPVYLSENYGEYGVRALPSTYIINPQGNMVASVAGIYHWDTAEVAEYLMHLAQ